MNGGELRCCADRNASCETGNGPRSGPAHTVRPWHPRACRDSQAVTRAGRRVPADPLHRRAADRPAARGRPTAGARRLPGRLDQRDRRRQGSHGAAGPAACRHRAADVRHRHRQHLGQGAADRARRRRPAAEAYPGRLVLGLGTGYPQQAAAVGREFGSPLASMRDYLERMAAPTMTPAPAAPYPRIVAANGQKMMALAGELADGALPAGLPPQFTARARAALGPASYWSWRCPRSSTPTTRAARAQARQAAAASLGRPWYAAAIAGLGYSEQQIASVAARSRRRARRPRGR